MKIFIWVGLWKHWMLMPWYPDEIQLKAADLFRRTNASYQRCRSFERFQPLRDTNQKQYSIKTVTGDVHSNPIYLHPNFSLKKTINFNLLCSTFQMPTFRFRPKQTSLLSWQILGKFQHFAIQKSEFVAGRKKCGGRWKIYFVSKFQLSVWGNDMKSLSWKSNFVHRELHSGFCQPIKISTEARLLRIPISRNSEKLSHLKNSFHELAFYGLCDLQKTFHHRQQSQITHERVA